MLALAFVLAFVILPTVSYYPPLSDDEGRILSSAHTLASQGRLGSDLYQGAWNADQSFYLSLPVQRILIALAFRLAGEQVWVGRIVSFLAALALLGCAGTLAKRWYGLKAAFAATFLLLFWRSFIGTDSLGLPFLGTARSARYDLTAVALMWLALLAFDFYLQKPARGIALLTGIAAGAATLTQFFGGFVIVVIAAVLVLRAPKTFFRERSAYWILLGFVLALLPYIIYIASDYSSFVTQTFVLKASRTRFSDWTFYIQNLATEATRYHQIAERAFFDSSSFIAQITALLTLIGVIAALGNLLYHLRRHRNVQEFILPLTLFVFSAGLALIESTKSPLYSIVLYPSLCIALGVLWQDIIQARRNFVYRLGVIAATVVVVVAVLAKFAGAYSLDRANAARASHYQDTVTHIAQALPHGAQILTSGRMAWGLHEFVPATTTFLATEWKLERDTPNQSTLAEWLTRAKVEYLVLDEAAFVDFATDQSLNTQLFDFIANCTNMVAVQKDFSYGAIQIYQRAANRPNCAQ